MNRIEFQPQGQWFDSVKEIKREDEDVIKCTKCSCSWMELLTVYQFDKDHSLILGQKPVAMNNNIYYVFKCPKCGEIYEPQVQIGTQGQDKKNYDRFLDQMMEPLEKDEEKI